MFLSEKFYFNNIDFSEMDIYLCDFESTLLNEIGFNYKVSLNRNSSFKNNPMYTEEDSGDYEIELNLLYYDKQKKVKLTWDNDAIKNVYDMLITDNFCEFYTEDNMDMVYYFKVVSIQKVFTPDRKGYLRVTFKSLDKYCYIKQTTTKTVNGLAELNIDNPSNEGYKPIVEITNNGSLATINKVNDLEIINLDYKETIIIDNLMCTALDPNGNNLFSNINRKWITIPSGKSVLKLNGKMTIKIMCLYPIVM